MRSMRNLLIESHSRIHMKININVRGMAWRSARPSAPAESARVEAKLRCETFAIKLKELSIRQTKPKALTPPPNRSPSTIGPPVPTHIYFSVIQYYSSIFWYPCFSIGNPTDTFHTKMRNMKYIGYLVKMTECSRVFGQCIPFLCGIYRVPQI